MTTRPRWTIYYGMRRFLLLAPSFVLEPTVPYRRLSSTLVLARRNPFLLECSPGETMTTRAALIAPKVQRRRIVAVDADLAIFGLPIGPALGTEPVRSLEPERFAHLGAMLDEASFGRLSCEGVDTLFREVTTAILGHDSVPGVTDPRVDAALRLIDEWPFEAVTLDALADRLAISPSRLRHLVKDATGHTVSHYARWTAVWRAISLWTEGRKLTDIAHEVGFHDLSHVDRAFKEMFGLNPSSLIRPEDVTLIRCP